MTRHDVVQGKGDLEALAQEACNKLGLLLEGPLPAPGGRVMRLRKHGTRSRSKPGWLRILRDAQGGMVLDWSSGERLFFFLEAWSSDTTNLAAVAARKAAIRKAQKVAEKERLKLANLAALRAVQFWRRGRPASPDHPYLQRKGITEVADIKMVTWGNLLMVPVQTQVGSLRSLQFIAPDGERRFLKDGELQGNFCPLGLPPAFDDVPTVLICEGVSTGLTLRQATGLPVVCAFGATNLQAVSEAIRSRHQHAHIVIAGDDDWKTRKPVVNPGKTFAQLAAQAVGGELVLPDFAGCDRAAKDTDFNDMAARRGLESVRRLFADVMQAEPVQSDPQALVDHEETEAQGDPLDGIASGYRSSGGRIVWEGGDNIEPVQLANFAAKITGEVLVDDGAELTKRLEISWRLRHRRGTFQIPAREFSTLNWPMEKISASAVISPGAATRDRLRAGIQYISGEIPLSRVYAQTGWREHEGHWAYLHNAGAIGAEDVTTELLNGVQRFSLPEPPTGEGLRDALRASLKLLDVAPDRVSCPLFAAIYRAPFQQSDFSLLFVGQSGSGKSSVAALAQAHFGASMWYRNTLPVDWSSTAFNIETAMFQAADALLVVDEGEAAKDSPAARAELEGKMSRVLRSVGNQSTRGRMKPDGTMVPDKPPRALVVATKEEALQGASLVARTLTLSLSPGEAAGGEGVSGLGPWQEDARSGVYAKAMAGYLAWLAQDLPGHKETFRVRFEEVRAKLAKRLAHPRTPDIIGQLASAARSFLRFAVDADAISETRAKEMHRRILDGLIEAASEQIDAQVAADPVEQFFDLLRAVLAGGRAHMYHADGRKPAIPTAYGWRQTDVEHLPQGEMIGWIAEDGSLYLLMQSAYAVCQSLAKANGQPIEVGEAALRRRMATAGKILSTEPGKKKRLTNRVSINGVRMVVTHVENPLTAGSDTDDGSSEDDAQASLDGSEGAFPTLATA